MWELTATAENSLTSEYLQQPTTTTATNSNTSNATTTNNINTEELGAVPMVTMAQNAADCRNTAHSRGSHALTRTLPSTQLQPRGANCQLGYYRMLTLTAELMN